MHLKRWVGPPYYRSSLPFIARVEIDLLLILNKQSLQSKAWSSSNKYWTTLNVFFPKSTKNTKVESATRYPDHQILSQSQGRAPFPYFIFPVPAPTHPPTLGPPGLLCKSASHRSASPGNSAPRLQCPAPFPPTHPPP